MTSNFVFKPPRFRLMRYINHLDPQQCVMANQLYHVFPISRLLTHMVGGSIDVDLNLTYPLFSSFEFAGR